METIEGFSEHVGSIYDCIAEPQLWPAALQRICNHFDGEIAALSVMDIDRREARFGAVCGNQEAIEQLITTYAARMPLYQYVPLMDVDAPLILRDFFTLAGPGTAELFLERMGGWMKPFGICDGLLLAVFKAENRIGSFVINTTSRRPPISPRERSDLALLAPHIRRAVTIGDLFEIGQRESSLFRAVVDSIAVPILVVSQNMRLHYANTAAQAIIDGGIIARHGSGQMQFTDTRAHAAIENAIRIGARSEVALGASGIGIPMARHERPAVAHVLPLARRAATVPFHGQAAAAIFVATPGTQTVSSVDAIAALFGLTAAEKRVTTQIANGLSRAEIAVASGVTDGTVKSQLAAIFDKTGVNSQRELELLIRELTPPVSRS